MRSYAFVENKAFPAKMVGAHLTDALFQFQQSRETAPFGIFHKTQGSKQTCLSQEGYAKKKFKVFGLRRVGKKHRIWRANAAPPMLRGRASLVRLVGKRRRFPESDQPPLDKERPLLDPHDDPSTPRKIQRNGNGESSSYAKELSSARSVDHYELEQDNKSIDQHNLDWVSCPVCGKSIRGTHDIVNSHLDFCLNGRAPRKLTQSTLFQFSFNSRSDNKDCCRDSNQSKSANNLKKLHEETKSAILYSPSSFGDIDNSETAVNLDYDLYKSSYSYGTSSPEDGETKCSITCNKVDIVTPLIFHDTYISKHNLVSENDDVPLETLETYIVGRTFYDEVELKQGANISFLRDPGNIKDQYAIKVFYSNQMVGFLPRDLAKHLSPLIDSCHLKLEGFISSLPKNSSDVVPVRVLCQKLPHCKNGPHGDQYFNSLWSNAIRVVESTRTFPPNMKKYQLNFHILMQEVMKHHTYLFTDEERSFLGCFDALSDDSQRLFIRLYTRKGPWFRMSNVSYPEVSDAQFAIGELCENGYMYCWDPLKLTSKRTLREVLNMLTVQELREILSLSHLKKNSSGLRREQLCDCLTTLYAEGTCLQLARVISKKLGLCICVSYLADNLLWRIQRLFFLDGEQDLSAFLLVDLGLVKYPSYVINISHCIFPARSDLLAYEEAIRVAQVMDESLDENNMEMVSQCIETSEGYLSNQTEGLSQFSCHEPAGALLFHFSAAWVYSKVATLGVSVFERERRYEDAIKLLKQLLSRIPCDGKRGYWALRLSVDLEHLGLLEESLSVAEKSLADHWVRAGSRIALQRRVLHLGRPPRRWKIPDFAKLLKQKINEVHVRGRPLDNKQGIKSRFYGDNGEQCGVEELALQYYAGEGWQGVHSESGIWMTLFALLMWDVIFADIPDVFRTRFQTAPLDLECDSFYLARRSLIESQLQKIEEGMAISVLTASWNAHVGTSCRGVRWDRLPLNDLQLVVSCIKGATLASLCRMLAQDYRSWSSGMPDLLLWRCCENGEKSTDELHSVSFGISGKIKLVEVKGPNDRLSEQQHAWLLVLIDCGFDVEVCKVRPMSIDE